jgi:choloylglycine hydrolase
MEIRMIKKQIVHKAASIISACAMLLSSVVQSVQACTGIRLAAADGTVVYARTMEFAIDFHSDLMMVPRGYTRTGTIPRRKERAQVEGEICQRRAEWRGVANLVRRVE